MVVVVVVVVAWQILPYECLEMRFVKECISEECILLRNPYCVHRGLLFLWNQVIIVAYRKIEKVVKDFFRRFAACSSSSSSSRYPSLGNC